MTNYANAIEWMLKNGWGFGVKNAGPDSKFKYDAIAAHEEDLKTIEVSANSWRGVISKLEQGVREYVKTT